MKRSPALSLFFLGLVIACSLGWERAGAEDYLDFFEQGEFALRVEKWDKAIQLFSKSIQDNPKFFLAYHYRAIAYSKSGQYDNSIEDLKKVVELNPQYPEAYALMGLVYEIKKDYPAALKVYREALAREKRQAVKTGIENYIRDVEAKMKKK